MYKEANLKCPDADRSEGVKFIFMYFSIKSAHLRLDEGRSRLTVDLRRSRADIIRPTQIASCSVALRHAQTSQVLQTDQ